MKIAVCINRVSNYSEKTIEKMLEAQSVLEWHYRSVYSYSNFSIGAVHTFERLADVPLLRKGSTGNVLFITGLPIHKSGSIESYLNKVVGSDYRSAGRFLSELDGAFAAVFYDAESNKIVVVTDFLGMEPLYIFQKKGCILLSTEIKGITRTGMADTEMDFAGWGGFIGFGHTLGNSTLIKGIRRVGPAKIFIIDPEDVRIKSRRYWEWPEGNSRMKSGQIDTGAIVETLKRDCIRYTEYSRNGVVLLSGGFDSRLILAMLKDIKQEPKAMVLDHADEFCGIDGYLGSRISDIYSVSSSIVSTSRSFYNSSDYIEYVKTSELASPSLGLFISQVARNLRPSMHAVWEGVAPGCILAPLHQSSGGFKEYLANQCASWNSRRWLAAKRVFGKQNAEKMYQALSEQLKQITENLPDNEFGVSRFVVSNRTRNRTAPNPLKVYSNYVLSFTPGFSKDFWSISAKIPYRHKAGQRLYLRILKSHYPSSMDVPVLSGNRLYPPLRPNREYRFEQIINKIQKNIIAKISGAVIRRLITGRWSYWDDFELVDSVIGLADAKHPDLDSDSVEKVKRSKFCFYKGINYQQKELLFYWQIWQWMMSGEIQSPRVLKLKSSNLPRTKAAGKSNG